MVGTLETIGQFFVFYIFSKSYLVSFLFLHSEFVKTEQAAINTYEQDRADFDSFAAIIRKYVGIKELTPTVVNEFVKKNRPRPDKSSGHRRQKIQIVWNFIGELEQDGDTQTIERQRKSKTA